MDRHDGNSDTEIEYSVPEVLSRDQIDALDNGNLIRTGCTSEQRSIDQRFIDMNKQISDLTGLVLALTEKLSLYSLSVSLFPSCLSIPLMNTGIELPVRERVVTIMKII